MKARDILDFLQKNLHFSSKSVDKLRLYVDLLLRYNKKLNLISKTTEKTVWNRHVLDSAQIIQYIPNDAKNIVGTLMKNNDWQNAHKQLEQLFKKDKNFFFLIRYLSFINIGNPNQLGSSLFIGSIKVN